MAAAGWQPALPAARRLIEWHRSQPFAMPVIVGYKPSPMDDKEALYDVAIDLVAEGKLDEAITKYRAAIALDGTYIDAWHGLAMALAEVGAFEEAVEAGKKLVELDPDDILGYTNLSRFYQQMGNIPEAEHWAAKARVLDWKRQLHKG